MEAVRILHPVQWQHLSDWIVVQISANPGETFLDRMIALVEGAKHKSIPLPANARLLERP